MSIDWTKAPEGTIGAMVAGFSTASVGFGGIEWIPSSGTPYEHYSQGFDAWTYHEAPKPWSGEGLPPVGAVCEIKHHKLGWVRCEIVAHKVMDCGGKAHAIAWIDANTIDQSQGLRFRQIRTSEQIAIDEIVKVLQQECCAGDYDGSLSAKALYDAGYRKQVTP
jgi:hypothetical protein